MRKKITILGVGNILLTDEGVGVRVIEELERNFTFPSNVEVYDGGTGGMSLLSVIEEADYLIVVDSVLVGESAGTIVKFNFADLPSDLTRKLSAHEIDIIEVLNIAQVLGKRPPTVIIGIQPKDISSYGTKLTIEKHIPELVELVIDELKTLGFQATPKNHQDS
ncbi:MAG: HyaD/HybD family hydrogenase maturation endopeptidase [bacterium]